MRKWILFLGIVAALLCAMICSANAQSISKSMKMNAGFVTSKLKETKSFYTDVLKLEVVFENDFYLLLKVKGGSDQLSFLLPNHESQQPLFQPPFNGKGAYMTFEVDNVDEVFQQFKEMKIPIAITLRDEPWGDRHFAIVDPNGIGIDIVTYKSQD
jgi:catechol 2,3-dioxygenase-like lactoylglutathione lyase family enzyme